MCPDTVTASLFALRTPCPVGACTCGHAQVRDDPTLDARVLRLTREEEARLVRHISRIDTWPALRTLQQQLRAQLGVQLLIAPGKQSTQGLRGLHIALTPQPGLCRKTHQAVTTAVRQCLAQQPQVAWALLNESSLFADF